MWPALPGLPSGLCQPRCLWNSTTRGVCCRDHSEHFPGTAMLSFLDQKAAFRPFSQTASEAVLPQGLAAALWAWCQPHSQPGPAGLHGPPSAQLPLLWHFRPRVPSLPSYTSAPVSWQGLQLKGPAWPGLLTCPVSTYIQGWQPLLLCSLLGVVGQEGRILLG